jgi:dihydropteroate synthase
VQAFDRHEKIAWLDPPGVIGNPGDLDLTIPFQARARDSSGDVDEFHPGSQHNRPVIADIGDRRFAWGTRTFVMGIVNVTPDSFSGDGLGSDHAAAVMQGLRMVDEGADMLDVGGESTRPGHVAIPAADEIARIEPVLRRLAKESGVPVSVDTYKLEVAEAAVDLGATILNDIWGLTRSPGIANLAARTGCGLVVMHNQDGTDYTVDLLQEIKRFLKRAALLAVDAGVPKQKVMIDPGIGFGKTADQNWEVMRRLGELNELGFPILVGTSRKSFIGKLLDLPADQRIEGTTATVVASVLRGADVVRVHDVLAMTRAVRVADRMR